MIHKRLQTLRKQRGISQKEMAEKLHKSPSSYSRMEKGEVKIALEELPAIAALLDCTVDNLLRDTGSINMQQHNEHTYAHSLDEPNNNSNDFIILLNSLMEFQVKQEEKMQHFMKAIIAELKAK